MKRQTKEQRTPIATWFRAEFPFWGAKISTIRVVGFTDKTVTYLNDAFGEVIEQRANIYSDHWYHSPTFEEAKEWLIASAEERVDDARRRLKAAQDVLGNAKGIKNPLEEKPCTK